MSQIEISEVIPPGKKRFVWPWAELENLGEYFIVKDPKNVRNGRQSVFQANAAAGTKKFKGSAVEGGFKVERIV